MIRASALADWMVSPANPFFAKSLVNRYWKHFFGRGIVDPEDDMRETNPPTNPKLLEALAQHFIESHYDLKDLVRTICRSQLYQLHRSPIRSTSGTARAIRTFIPVVCRRK